MKNLQYFLVLVLLMTPAITSAEDVRRIPATSRITSVTVYQDRALTTRSFSMNIKPGNYLITFDNLPSLILDDSVRVEGKGSAGATISGLEVKRVFLEQSGEKRVKELDAEIRALEQSSGALDAKKVGLSSQKAFFESIRVAWGDRISKELAIGRPTSAELLEAANFVGAGIAKTEQQSLDIEIEKGKITDKIDSLRRQREELADSGRKETKTIEVMMHVAREGSLALDLATVISNTGWEPSYDVRLAGDTKSAELTFRAMIWQQTGEDWNNVDLTLSTARPSAGGAPPELSPWRISFYRPPPAPSSALAPASFGLVGRKGGGSAMNLKIAKAEGAPQQTQPVAYETAEISSEQSSVTFHIPRPLDIPSDGSWHGTVVATEQLPVNIDFMAIPKLSPLVFLKSEIVNRAEYPLLPGKVNTFTGNTFTGSSKMKKVAVGEKFDLFFGPDDRVKVRREELKQHKDAGLFSSNHVSYRYRLEMNNFRKESAILTLYDQLPLAGDEEIKVSLVNPSIRPEGPEGDGRIIWRVPLEAGEKKDLTYVILVEYPKDREITGYGN